MNIFEQAKATIIDATQTACPNINAFCCQALQIRGGRIGSGMGFLLEALWGLYVNQILQQQSVNFELGWFSSHGYNDFACIEKDAPWNPETQMGELMRIEAKSMNLEADESKGHFDELIEDLSEWDLLLVLIWRWEPVDAFRVCPYIQDYFIGSARSIAMLRDQLHIARGGSFVDRNNCPDQCPPETCLHHGEPLNSKGSRERASGPKSCTPKSSSFAANFGGLVRMLQTSSDQARREFCKIRAEDNSAHEYISFIHRNYPKLKLGQSKSPKRLP